MDWKELYPKTRKPRVEDIESYLEPEKLKLFKSFVEFLAAELNLTYVVPKYTSSSGWNFQIGRSGMIMVKNIVFDNNCFSVDGKNINNDYTLNEVLISMEEVYNNKFKPEFEEYSRKRSENQKQRTQRRRQRDEEFHLSLKNIVDEDKLNKFRWSPCVSRQKLHSLYDCESRGMLDEELLDDVGYTLYARCLQGKEEGDLKERGKLKCHNCGNILSYSPGVMTCSCGHSYIFRDYMKSFRENNMPHGAARHIFDGFILRWPSSKTSRDKMLLIDWLIHEFHINIRSGVKGRPVGINLIQGTNTQVKELILKLAYC